MNCNFMLKEVLYDTTSHSESWGLHPGIQYKPVTFAFSDWAGMMVVEREKSIIQTGLKSNPKRCGIA